MSEPEDSIRLAIATRISDLRSSHGMTMVAFAKLLQVSRPTAYAMIEGKRSLSIENIVLLANTFQVSLDFILGRSPPQSSNYHSQTEAMIAHELIKLQPGSLDRVIRLIPVLRQEFYRPIAAKTRPGSEAVLSAIRGTMTNQRNISNG